MRAGQLQFQTRFPRPVLFGAHDLALDLNVAVVQVDEGHQNALRYGAAKNLQAQTGRADGGDEADIEIQRTVLGVAVATLAANAILTFGNLHGLVAVQGDVTRSHQVLAELARLEGTLRSAEAAQRTFLATEGRASLASLEAATTVLGIRLDRIGELVGDEEDQTGRLSLLGRAARRHLDGLGEEARLFTAERRAGDRLPPEQRDPVGETRRLLQARCHRNQDFFIGDCFGKNSLAMTIPLYY